MKPRGDRRAESASYYRRHKTEVLIRVARWRKANPDKVRAMNATSMRKRSAIRRAESELLSLRLRTFHALIVVGAIPIIVWI